MALPLVLFAVLAFASLVAMSIIGLADTPEYISWVFFILGLAAMGIVLYSFSCLPSPF